MNHSLKLVLFILLGSILISCKKEVETREPTLEDIQKKLVGNWKAKYVEIESYSGNVMTRKTVLTSNLSYVEYKADFTYVSVFNTDPPFKGTWELLSPSYLHLDKGNPTEDRYYHIISLDEHNLVYRGPFDANGNVKFASLFTAYNFK